MGSVQGLSKVRSRIFSAFSLVLPAGTLTSVKHSVSLFWACFSALSAFSSQVPHVPQRLAAASTNFSTSLCHLRFLESPPQCSTKVSEVPESLSPHPGTEMLSVAFIFCVCVCLNYYLFLQELGGGLNKEPLL